MKKRVSSLQYRELNKNAGGLTIFVPILGLWDNNSDTRPGEIQELTQYGMEELNDICYNRITFATIDNELDDLLHVIANIFHKQNDVCVKANFELPAITNPGVFRSQQEITSLGLGLITKLFYDYRIQNQSTGNKTFDILCITGVLNKNPSSEQKINGDFLSNETGKIEEKLRAFLHYIIKKENLKDKRCVFVYCGSDKEETLNEILKSYNLTNVSIKKISNFNNLMDFIAGSSCGNKKPVKKRLWLLIPSALLIIILLLLIPMVALKPDTTSLSLLQRLKKEQRYETKSPALKGLFDDGITAITPAETGWAEKAILKECLYITDCSFTEYATHNSDCTTDKEAYGCLNNVRIYQKGPDWVKPRESAMGAIGLMKGTCVLMAKGYNITPFDQVLRKFFWDWAADKAQGNAHYNKNLDIDNGAWTEEIQYSRTGNYEGRREWNAGATAAMLIALWKYYEYNLDTGQTITANDWLHHAWPHALRGADYLCRMYNEKYRLVQSHALYPDMWIGDSSLACTALKCIARWADVAYKAEHYDYSSYSSHIAEGLRDMADTGAWKNFFRVRRADGKKEYAGCIDQLCFIPFEVDALPPGDLNNFAARISDWWTEPGAGIDFKMTFQTNDPADWRYWGTHWKHYFTDNVENTRLYPGPGFQLARVEWKYGTFTDTLEYKKRAVSRFRWGYDPAYSNLWFGAKGLSEAGVANGIVDYRDQNDKHLTDSSWARFIDTSSYFIQVCAMIFYNTDTKLSPVK